MGLVGIALKNDVVGFAAQLAVLAQTDRPVQLSAHFYRGMCPYADRPPQHAALHHHSLPPDVDGARACIQHSAFHLGPLLDEEVFFGTPKTIGSRQRLRATPLRQQAEIATQLPLVLVQQVGQAVEHAQAAAAVKRGKFAQRLIFHHPAELLLVEAGGNEIALFQQSLVVV